MAICFYWGNEFGIGLGHYMLGTHTIANLLWRVSFMAHLICYEGFLPLKFLPSKRCGFSGHYSKTRTNNIEYIYDFTNVCPKGIQ